MNLSIFFINIVVSFAFGMYSGSYCAEHELKSPFKQVWFWFGLTTWQLAIGFASKVFT